MSAEDKANQPESQLARALLASKVPSRAKLMCPKERHTLGAVYVTPEGVRYLVTPAWKFLAKSMYTDAARDPLAVKTAPAWSWEIDAADATTDSIVMRCRCGMATTNLDKLRRQIADLPVGDRWLMVDRMWPADHAQTAEIRSAVAEREAVLAALPADGAPVSVSALAEQLQLPLLSVRLEVVMLEDDGALTWVPGEGQADMWEVNPSELVVRRMLC